MFSALRGVSVVGAVGAGALMRASAQCAEEHPPTGLSESVRALPQWIQLGCGDAPYNCAEKGATFAPDGKQPTNMDINKLSATDIDPECKYVLTTRVRTGRSIRGFKLPPTISFQGRRDLEAP